MLGSWYACQSDRRVGIVGGFAFLDQMARAHRHKAYSSTGSPRMPMSTLTTLFFSATVPGQPSRSVQAAPMSVSPVGLRQWSREIQTPSSAWKASMTCDRRSQLLCHRSSATFESGYYGQDRRYEPKFEWSLWDSNVEDIPLGSLPVRIDFCWLCAEASLFDCDDGAIFVLD